jgi:hypothetical protein
VDAVAAGTDYPEPRLTEDWLRAEHDRALTRARTTHPGEPSAPAAGPG